MKPRFLAGPDDDWLNYAQRAGQKSGREKLELREDFIFRDSRGVIWIAPTGLKFDGASIPRPFWSITGHPTESRHIPAGAIHDQVYQTGFRLTIDPEVLDLVIIDEMTPAEICTLPRVEIAVERAETDCFGLYEPLTVTPGNSCLHSKVVYHAVRIGGFVAWNGHVARRARERRPFSMLNHLER